jgi:hypothetical protein
MAGWETGNNGIQKYIIKIQICSQWDTKIYHGDTNSMIQLYMRQWDMIMLGIYRGTQSENICAKMDGLSWTSYEPMDDWGGYPHDLGNLHMIII